SLQRGVDSTKDQSYFLFNLTAKQLGKTLFPLGNYTKDEIRQKAAEFKIAVANKKDSQEICFVTDNDYAAFINNNIGDRRVIKGAIVSEEGKFLKEHDGIHNFTIGQRKHIGVALGFPAYVTSIDPDSGDVTVGKKDKLYKKELRLTDVTFIHPEAPPEFNALIQIRYRFIAQPGTIIMESKTKAKVIFEKEVLSITPGQAAVFYDNEKVLGGGWIVS
ncbi:MAG: tRNA 2-thiouridine(34) synthase MnmA, partial [Nitrospinae bacterium]|nr:tRNA 2-thiouridine(34) synthase MnmA [Nitrospinota bacterium]